MRHAFTSPRLPHILVLALLTAGCGGDYSDAPADEAEIEPPAEAETPAETAAPMITTESGLQYQVLREGDGASPNPGQNVTVHYRGTFPDGGQFDSSYDRGEPAQFSLNGVIPGFAEAIQLMRVGGHVRAYIPSELGYGEQGMGAAIGPNQDLVFEIELLGVH